MKHPTEIPGYDLKELAKLVEGLSYDKTAEFLKALANTVLNASCMDWDRGRKHLAKELAAAGQHLEDAADYMDRAWKICKPHMK